MGMYDYVIIEEGVDLPKFPEDKNHTEIEWQSKDINYPSLSTYKITEDRRLLRKEIEKRELTEDELDEKARKNGYKSWEAWEKADTNIDEPLPTRKYTVEDEWWADHNMHGSFEFHASTSRIEGFEDFFWSYEARYTKGELQEIEFLGERGSGNMTPPYAE